ncbi:spatacsin-like [Anneissia japonica]|uniref:spatacsin-like n=1 Tax=Anneissia japonica TaxID=1529436 RepID=UPI0014259C1B|nr:spatacsin-like [Anneissia japonica]
MSASMGRCFDVSLGKLDVDLKNVKSILEAPGRKVLALLFVDGHVSLIEKDKPLVADLRRLSGIDSFCWCEGYNHLDQHLTFRTYNSKLKCINEWSIQLSDEGGIINQRAEWKLCDTIADIKRNYKEIPIHPEICILQLKYCLILLVHDVVVVAKLNFSGLVDIVRSFQVREFTSEGSVTDIVVKKNVVFILKENGFVSIYSLTHGQLVAVIRLIDYWKLLFPGAGILPQNGKATHLAVSSNLCHLLVYFTGTKFGLHHINLDEYFSTHIYSFQKIDTLNFEQNVDEDEVDFHKKVNANNRGWKKQVVGLKSKLLVKGHTKGVGTSPLRDKSKHWFENFEENNQNTSTKFKEEENKITGFTKKLTRGHDHLTSKRSSPGVSKELETIFDRKTNHKSFVFKIPRPCRQSEIKNVSVAMEIATLWFKGDSVHHGMFLLVDLQNNQQEYVSFTEPTVVSVPCSDGQAPLMITETTMSALAINVDQEFLVNKVMTYENATLAERLCEGNNWAHCSIPIHALKVGLKHRQLDTIAFFLKCREGVFRNHVDSEPISSTSTDIKELWEAIDLLLTSIVDNMSEPQSKQYSDQLVQLALTFVNHLIQNTWETQTLLQVDCVVKTARVKEIKTTSQRLMGYACDLRGFLKDAPSWCSKTIEDVQHQKDLIESECLKGYYWFGKQTQSAITKYGLKSRKAIVESAILNSCLPLAQAYLYQTMDHPVAMESAIPSNISMDKHIAMETVVPSNSMYELIQISRSLVLRSLIDGDLKKASKILLNMGFNVNVELKHICMQTTDRRVRDFLICELQKMREFDVEEIAAIEFINHFEKIYPKHSFEEATLKAMERQNEHWKEPMIIACIPHEESKASTPSPSFDVDPSTCDESSIPSTSLDIDSFTLGEASIPSPSLDVDSFILDDHDHTNLPLEWVIHWDKETRERILFERISEQDSKAPDIIPEEQISMESAWQYLTMRADWEQIKTWIKASFPLAEEDASAIKMPINHPLELSVANKLEEAPDFMKNWILDELATRGVFASEEMQDFDKLLKRLSRIHCVISSHHPLTLGRVQLNMNSFYSKFVAFCVQRDLHSVLYEFLDNMDLCLSDSDVTKLELPVNKCPWLNMMLHFRWVGKYLSDPSCMFQTSLACSRVFLKTVQPTVMSLLEAGRALAAMATLMYAPGTLKQAMTPVENSDEELWKVDHELLESSLRSFGTLHSAMFPSRVDGVPLQHVSLYELLQAYLPFDMSKMFLWQSTNDLAIREPDKHHEMPHFSDSELVAKYGHKEELDFTYYLKQGRPSFAFTSFVENQFELGGTTKKRISQAQATACLIALRMFACQGVAAGCVAFIEMIGRESTRLRVDLQTSNIIYNFQQKEEEWRKQHKTQWQQWLLTAEKKIAGSMLNAFKKRGKKSSEMLKKMLEAAISNRLATSNIHSCSMEAARAWDIAVMFCGFHRLPLSDVYLKECAKIDDWLHFTVFAHQHQYPKEHVLELVQLFKSSSLSEHLSLAFENPVYGPSFPPKEQQGVSKQSTVTKKKLITRDSRTNYLFKVGFDSSRVVGKDSTDEGEEDDIDGDYLLVKEHSGKQFDDLVLENVASDLFGVILACQSASQPAKMFLAYSAIFKQPSLAVLSGCFQNSNLLNCLCMFLMTSMRNEDVAMVTGTEMASLQWHEWTVNELMNIVDIAMETRKTLMLCKAFQIFQPNSPLTTFLEFICDFCVKSDEVGAAKHLANFHDAFIQIVKSSCSLQGSTVAVESITDISSSRFIENSISRLTLLMFKTCRNFPEICRLLKLMAGVNFSEIFSHPVANYAKLYELSLIIKSTSVQLDIRELLSGDGSIFHKHCQEVLVNLQTVKDFASAKRFALAAGLNMDHVVLHELKDELQQMKNNSQWQSETVRHLFWEKCNKELRSSRISNKVAFQFFRSIASDPSLNLSTSEKILILCMALDWLSKVTATTSASYVSLEQEVWRLRLDLEIENIQNEDHGISLHEHHVNPRKFQDILGSDVKYHGPDEFLYLADYGLTDNQPKQPAEAAALQKIVGDLLGRFCIIQAFRICDQFKHFSQDLTVVLTCIKLARGKVTVDELSAQMKTLLARGRRKRPSLSESMNSLNRTYSLSSISSAGDIDESNEVLMCLETFCEHSKDGRKCCERITNCYKVAQILNCPYEEVVTQSLIETLKIILQSNTPQQFSTAKDFIQTTGMNDTDVSSFLADMIIKQVTLKAQKHQQGQYVVDSSQVQLSRKPSDKEELSKLIKLCQNPATLGNRLIQEAKALLDNPSTSKIAHTLLVELIIRAHDCHTICCNMEGISSVLRLCRDCTPVLGRAEEHRLMIRLIMGVGRYSEMMYAFEYLHKAKKIEQLVKVGSKDGKLKIALLDYLKRCKPADPETYNMVSLKFRMHREIGEMLEKGALKNLRALADRPMETNIELQNCLQEILQGLTEAAQNYAKENCLRHAEHCICQARLVALQLHLLSSDMRVINLDSNEFHKFITHHEKFHEALLVARAYTDQHVNWSNALYYNVIQQGNFMFLDDFKRSLRLEESHFMDVSARYKHDQEKKPEMRENMERLLSYCKELKTAYDIATELNFQDIAMDMLKGEGGSYLRDVI